MNLQSPRVLSSQRMKWAGTSFKPRDYRVIIQRHLFLYKSIMIVNNNTMVFRSKNKQKRATSWAIYQRVIGFFRDQWTKFFHPTWILLNNSKSNKRAIFNRFLGSKHHSRDREYLLDIDLMNHWIVCYIARRIFHERNWRLLIKLRHSVRGRYIEVYAIKKK